MISSIKSFSFLAALLLIFPFFEAKAQNFTPLAEGEYEIHQNRIIYPSNLIFRGYYETTYMTLQQGQFKDKLESNDQRQEIGIYLKSMVKPNVSVNALIGNYDPRFSYQPSGYRYTDRNRDYDNPPPGLVSEFKELNVEYNHNPSAVFKVGRQEVAVGDRKGIIYRGYATGVSQTCGIGTWCYYIGSVKLGNADLETLSWAQLDYPVWQSGQNQTDPFVDKGQREQDSLNVELFRVIYQSEHTPLSFSGSMTGESSPNHIRDIMYMGLYFNSKNVNYNGLNLTWNYFNNQFSAHLIGMEGTRDYLNSAYTVTSTRKITGTATELNYSYLMGSDFKIALTQAKASGTNFTTGQDYTTRDTTSYFAIQNGYYGDSLIFMDGKQHTGQGHAFSNLSYAKASLMYREGANGKYSVTANLFQFKRVESMLNAAGHIGDEFNLIVRAYLEEGLTADLMLATFDAGDYYSTVESIIPTPTTTPKLSRMGANLRYSF